MMSMDTMVMGRQAGLTTELREEEPLEEIKDQSPKIKDQRSKCKNQIHNG